MYQWAYFKHFLISWKTLWVRAVKFLGNFESLESILRPNFIWSFWKWFCYLNMKLEKHFSFTTFVTWTILKKVYLMKICSNLMALTQIFLQGIKKFFEYAHCDMKILWISTDTQKNSLLSYHYWGDLLLINIQKPIHVLYRFPQPS